MTQLFRINLTFDNGGMEFTAPASDLDAAREIARQRIAQRATALRSVSIVQRPPMAAGQRQNAVKGDSLFQGKGNSQ